MNNPNPGAIDANHLAKRIVQFIAHLRLNDFSLGASETITALEIANRIDICSPAELRGSLKILLTARRSEWEKFDDLFEAYWYAKGAVKRRPTSKSDHTSSSVQSRLWQRNQEGLVDTKAQLPQGLSTDESERQAERADGRVAAARQTSIAKSDLRRILNPDELTLAERLAERLARAMRYRLSRRMRLSKQRKRLDLRRSIRRNLSKGGEPFERVWRKRPDRPVRIVVLLDVSGSMQQYSRIFLQFVKGLIGVWSDSDAYLFHTRIVRITDALRDKDPIRAMTKVSLISAGFGGGTKIGECLRTFNDRYARAALNSRSVVVLLSDGYDTGDVSELVSQLRKLRRKARRIVWLNPMLGWQDYQPVARAMSAALPHIDTFAAAHSLEAIAALEAEFARV
ncbi:MAG: vWA domain-containing protein [Hyphomicrobiaceae bacterium]